MIGVPEFSSVWLSDCELRQLLLGHSLHRRNAESGKEYSASFSPEGSVSLSGVWGSDAGIQSHMEGRVYARLCIDSSGRHNGCAMIYRNAGGTPAKGDELVWVDGSGAFPFSQLQ